MCRQILNVLSVLALLAALCAILGAKGRQLPLLEVPRHDMSVVVLSAPITRVHLGSNAYVAEVKDTFLLLRARRAEAPPTSLFVVYDQGQHFFHAMVAVTETGPRTYNFAQDLPAAAFEAQEEETQQHVAMAHGLEALEALPQAYHDVGIERHQLFVGLYALLQDENYTYVKVFFNNTSSIDFHVAAVHFSYQAREQAPLTPVLTPEAGCFLAYTPQMLTYVLPRYGTKARGALTMAWEEEGGERTLQLTVPAALLLNAPYAEDDLP